MVLAEEAPLRGRLTRLAVASGWRRWLGRLSGRTLILSGLCQLLVRLVLLLVEPNSLRVAGDGIQLRIPLITLVKLVLRENTGADLRVQALDVALRDGLTRVRAADVLLQLPYLVEVQPGGSACLRQLSILQLLAASLMWLEVCVQQRVVVFEQGFTAQRSNRSHPCLLLSMPGLSISD